MRVGTATKTLYAALAVAFAALAAYSFYRVGTGTGESVGVGVGYAVLAALWTGLLVGKSGVLRRPRKR